MGAHMEALLTDQDLDQFIWNCIENSTNARDFVDYLNHTYGTFAEQEAAYQKMLTYWGQADTPKQFDKAVAGLTEQAEAGNALAMFHIGRWYRLGYGVEKNDDIGLGWYRKGAEAGSTRCLINLARYTALTDEPSANVLFQKAAEMGDMYAHCYWADSDKENYDKHLELGAQADDAFAKYCYAFHLNKLAQSDTEKQHALDLIKKAAELGEASACTFVYYQYMYGSSICTVDKEQAAYWIKKAVRVGSAIGCTSYGRMLLDEQGRKEEGISYLKRASILEEVFGQTLLGHQLLYFGNTPELQAEGFAWTKAAAELGHKPAMDKLATAYRTGKGCTEDAQLALYWLQKGASLGNSNCQTALGTAYMAGDLVAQDFEKAHNLFHLAHIQGDPWGTYVLAVSYENGHGVDKDLERAFALYMEAAKKKLIRACYKVGMAYMWGEGVEEDIPAAAYWYKQAANGGDDDAQVQLGMMFIYGHGVEENVDKGFNWLQLSAEQDNPIALRELGLLYESGKGVALSMSEATRLISKAASLGDKKSIEWVDTHYPDKPDWLKTLCLTTNGK